MNCPYLVISLRLVGKLFHRHGHAAAKRLSRKLVCVHSMEQRVSCWMSSWENIDHAWRWVECRQWADWCTRQAILNSTHLWTGSQCSWCNTGNCGQFAYCLVISPTGCFAYETFRLLPGQFSHRLLHIVDDKCRIFFLVWMHELWSAKAWEPSDFASTISSDH